MRSEMELENLLLGPESGQVSNRHHFGTHGIKPNLMMNQERKYIFNQFTSFNNPNVFISNLSEANESKQDSK